MVSRDEIRRRLIAHFRDEPSVDRLMLETDHAWQVDMIARIDRDERIKRALIETAGLSIRACAAELNRRGVETPSGEGAWWPTAVVRERGLAGVTNSIGQAREELLAALPEEQTEDVITAKLVDVLAIIAFELRSLNFWIVAHSSRPTKADAKKHKALGDQLHLVRSALEARVGPLDLRGTLVGECYDPDVEAEVDERAKIKAVPIAEASAPPAAPRRDRKRGAQ
jgi:hypothetical protein